MKALLRGFFASLLLAMGGCGPGADAPKEPVWGKQPCEHCAMVLSDTQHGAQLVTSDGDRLYFDDLGCMVVWMGEHAGTVRRSWVRTIDTKAWLPVESAGFERSERTPMGFGFVGVSRPGSVAWTDVVDAVRRGAGDSGGRR